MCLLPFLVPNLPCGVESIYTRAPRRQGSQLVPNLPCGVESGATTTTINPDDVLRTGLAGGFAEASKVLVEQYKKLADETFPVIEVNAGRDVDLVFLQGIDLTEQEQVKEEKE